MMVNFGWGNGECGDLRRYRAHYDVIVMCKHYPRTMMFAKILQKIELNFFLGFHLNDKQYMLNPVTD